MSLNTTRVLLDLLSAAEQLATRRDRENLFRDLCHWVRIAVGAESVLLYCVHAQVDGPKLMPVGWCLADVEGGQWRDEGEEGELPADPFLATAIDSGAPWYRGTADDPDRIAIPVSHDNRVSWLLELRTPMAPGIRVLKALVTLVRTFEHLITQWEYANLDSLTGLLNRKTFDTQFEHLLALAERQRGFSHNRRSIEVRHPCWLGIVDIDFFKDINDTWGHLFGDEVLILLAKVMREVFRAEDTLFRFGGEEFVVMLRHVPEDKVKAIFERFRASVAAHDFPQIGQVTCSIGFASVDDRLTPAELVGRADEALYYAKDHGRNRVCCFDELVAAGELKAGPSARAQRDADDVF